MPRAPRSNGKSLFGLHHRRSQDFWLGGAQTLKNSVVFTEIESDFSAEIGNSNDFSAQIQVISKKKKKRSSPKLRVIFQPKSEIRTVFPPKIRWSPKKKKKRSSPKLRVVFRPQPLALLLLYCLITVLCANTEKKLQLNIVRLCCHNFLSLVEFWLGGPGPPGPPPGYAYGLHLYLAGRCCGNPQNARGSTQCKYSPRNNMLISRSNQPLHHFSITILLQLVSFFLKKYFWIKNSYENANWTKYWI